MFEVSLELGKNRVNADVDEFRNRIEPTLTDQNDPRVREDQFLGALLGMAIGDALGGPLRGMTAATIVETHGTITGYLTPANLEADSQEAIGQISDKSEIGLCIVESLTTNEGVLDFDNIAARMTFVARSPSKASMSATTLHGIERSAEHGESTIAEEDDEELAVATRGIPFGLMHAIGIFDLESLRTETDLVTRLSHGGRAATQSTLAVALGVCAASRHPGDLESWLTGRFPSETTPLLRSIRHIVSVVVASDVFERGILDIVSEGGDADAAGCIAGAVAGARFGASGIPQPLIDNLDARIYLSLAAPWYYRTALRRQGTVIDLRTT